MISIIHGVACQQDLTRKPRNPDFQIESYTKPEDISVEAFKTIFERALKGGTVKMARAKECDICGKLYKCYNDKKDKKKPNGYMLLNIDDSRQYWSHDPVDCCPECMESIQKHIETLRNKEGNTCDK